MLGISYVIIIKKKKKRAPTNNALPTDFLLSSDAEILLPSAGRGMRVGARTCANVRTRRARIPTEHPFFCTPPLVVGNQKNKTTTTNCRIETHSCLDLPLPLRGGEVSAALHAGAAPDQLQVVVPVEGGGGGGA